MTTPVLQEVTLVTDGSCLGNPGPGGAGAILIYQGQRKQISRGFKRTTNNRMEMLSVIFGLEALRRPCKVEVLSDSQYLVKNIEDGHPWRWRSKGWKLASKQPAKNADLWGRLLDLLEIHTVRFTWVRGHNGHELNEQADLLASTAAKGGSGPLEDDEGFTG